MAGNLINWFSIVKNYLEINVLVNLFPKTILDRLSHNIPSIFYYRKQIHSARANNSKKLQMLQSIQAYEFTYDELMYNDR